MTEPGRARGAWVALAVIAGAIAITAFARWVWAISIGGPVLYSEGAVAHAAILAREAREYAVATAMPDPAASTIFVAANYPPLYFRIAGLGDPFVIGRVASIASTLFVAGAIAWRARAAGVLTALALAAAWLATFPVIVWGAALKPDLVALALTAGAVVTIDRTPRRSLAAGALLAAAVWTKPTAALPALALAALSLRDGARGIGAMSLGAFGAIAMLAVAAPLGGEAFRHVVTWNALSWRPDQALLLVLVAGITISLLVAAPLIARGLSAPLVGYGVGALGIVILGGREGATINYLLDLSVAAALATASVAARLPRVFPLAMSAQLLVALIVFDPFGMLGRGATGAWGDPSRIAAVRSLPPGAALVEDSGLLSAAGREPIVDDLFLWSRVYASSDEAAFPEGPRLLGAVRSARFAAVVSEVDLERIGSAPEYARARWHPRLVAAVLERYTLDRTEGGLWVYRPR